MNSGTISYTLRPFIGLMSHSSSSLSFLRDIVNEGQSYDSDHELDVQVRSGDYFVTLATTLDSLSDKIRNHTVRVAIEDIVSDLIQLQDTYTITKNK
jgi:hypothetical protein